MSMQFKKKKNTGLYQKTTRHKVTYYKTTHRYAMHVHAEKKTIPENKKMHGTDTPIHNKKV